MGRGKNSGANVSQIVHCSGKCNYLPFWVIINRESNLKKSENVFFSGQPFDKVKIDL